MANRKDGVFEIKTEQLKLDNYNPRLYGESVTEGQEEIMAKIYEKEAIDELASSLAVNGYFKEEPIIVIPANPSDFDKIDETNFDNFEYIVIEGNRRTTSVKLLLKDYGIVDTTFPKIAEQWIEENLKQIPAIIYEKREDVDIYLSVRHISGHRKWDAFAKAKYIYDKVNKFNEEEKNIQKSIDKLSVQIGDKSNVVKKYYIYFKIFNEIEEKVERYSSRRIKDRFSLLEVALSTGLTPIAQYIGLGSFRNVDFEQDIVKDNKVEELNDITKWIFGQDDKGDGSIISDSRQINSLLKPILGNVDATQYLKEFGDVEGALNLTDGEANLIVGNIKKASKLVGSVLYKVQKYKENPDFLAAYAELQESVNAVQKLL